MYGKGKSVWTGQNHYLYMDVYEILGDFSCQNIKDLLCEMSLHFTERFFFYDFGNKFVIIMSY